MEEKRSEIPSELQSAIHIALFQAQQTYMAAAATELTDFKNEFRREMLEFMAQIRETLAGPKSPIAPDADRILGSWRDPSRSRSDRQCVDQSETPKPRKIQEPALLVASPTSEAAQDYFNDVEASRIPEAKQSASANDPNSQRVEEHDQSPGPRTFEYSASISNLSKDTERKAHQWLWVPVLCDSHVQLVNWRNQRHCRRQELRTPKTKFGQVQGADDPRPVGYASTVSVVEALYRPRAGGGWKDRSACRNFTERTHPVHEFESPMRIFNVADSPSEIGTQTPKSDPMASIWNKKIIARQTQSIQLRLLISGGVGDGSRWRRQIPDAHQQSPPPPRRRTPRKVGFMILAGLSKSFISLPSMNPTQCGNSSNVRSTICRRSAASGQYIYLGVSRKIGVNTISVMLAKDPPSITPKNGAYLRTDALLPEEPSRKSTTASCKSTSICLWTDAVANTSSRSIW
ncbi:hypothetical protein ACLKA6_008433 [Drosophila palustris]